MTDFSTSAMMAILQVTLAIGPAGLLVLLLGRRHIAATTTVTISALTVASALTIAAFAPMPGSWTWTSPAPAIESVNDVGIAAAPGLSPVHGIDLASVLALLTSARADAPQLPVSWRTMAAWGIAGCTALSLLSWMFGMLSVVRLRRTSRAIHDPSLCQLVADLSTELGVDVAVGVRSTAVIGSAATVGSRRPIILLADDWPTWSAGDLRAVLAHELAHIRRGDYRTGVWARVCVAINGYHPLVHWLAGRLHQAQEIAADRLAAGIAGGATVYRQALARMALREDHRWVSGVAQSFGSKRNNLMGRLDMLQVMDDRTGSPGRWARTALVGIVIGIGLLVSAVRGPAQSPTASAPAAQNPPYELGYLADDAHAFIAVRPAALLARPDMKPVLDTLTAALNSGFALLGVPPDTIRLDQIEQVVGPVDLKTFTEDERKKLPGGERHSISMSLVLIRMTGDFDWAQVLRSLPKTIPVTEKDKDLFEIRSALFGPNPMTVRLIDKRTIVTNTTSPEEAAKRGAARANRLGSGMMRDINNAGLAMVVENQAAKWTNAFKDNRQAEPIAAALGEPANMTLCLYWNAYVTCGFTANWSTVPTDVIRGEPSIVRLLERQIREAKAGDAADRRFLDMVDEMLRSAKLQIDGNLVRAVLTSSLLWSDILSVTLHKSSASVEVKEEKK